jgi:hypothetical protein
MADEAQRNPCPALSAKLAAALAAMREAGVNPTDAELAWLSRLAWLIEYGHTEQAQVGVLGAPAIIEGCTWWPMHRLARRWFIRWHSECTGESGVYLFLFAHAHSRPGDATCLYLADAATVTAMLASWSETLPIHDEAIAALVDRLRDLDGDRDSVPPLKPTAGTVNEATACGRAMKVFPGTTLDFWQYGVSCPDGDAMLAASGETTADRYADACTAFRRAVAWVYRAHGIEKKAAK